MGIQSLSGFDRMLDWIGRRLARKLRVQNSGYNPCTPSDFLTLNKILIPGDVLLIEGNQRVSSAIKYLTQSTWSHAAFYVGDALHTGDETCECPELIEVNLGEGCVAVQLSKYESYNTRICRAVGLTDDERKTMVSFMVGKLGLSYDMRNIFDLLRYFFPTPPIPVRWRRRMLAVGHGDPTRAICSSLIAQAFQLVQYPILPKILVDGETGDYARREIYHIRHHSLFAPRDFDLSPYFAIIKPTLEGGFDPHDIVWGDLPVGEDCKPPETE
jgi:hypothetical protein